MPLTEPRYRFDKTDDDLLHDTLKDSLNSTDTDITTQDELEELAVTLQVYVPQKSMVPQNIHRY